MKGLMAEITISKTFHSEHTALLVSSQVLRSRQMGQIDLARFIRTQSGWLIEVGEVKSSSMGIFNSQRTQIRRLALSQQFLSGIFGCKVRLQYLK